jgi:hypothetical protein
MDVAIKKSSLNCRLSVCLSVTLCVQSHSVISSSSCSQRGLNEQESEDHQDRMQFSWCLLIVVLKWLNDNVRCNIATASRIGCSFRDVRWLLAAKRFSFELMLKHLNDNVRCNVATASTPSDPEQRSRGQFFLTTAIWVLLSGFSAELLALNLRVPLSGLPIQQREPLALHARTRALTTACEVTAGVHFENSGPSWMKRGWTVLNGLDSNTPIFQESPAFPRHACSAGWRTGQNAKIR